MMISAFGQLVSENLKPHSLMNYPVVIDGQNFFYKLYERSGLQYKYGCESDNYADYLRKYLEMFKRANVECYFIFKGGHKDENVMHKKYTQKEGKFKPPIFMKDVYKQVVDEMGFNYTITKYESKRECIAFAQRNNCSVISDDTSFCLSSITYIPSTSLNFNEDTVSIDCGLFRIQIFMQKYQLSKEKMAMFVAVTSELYKCIPKNCLPKFLKAIEISSKSSYDINVDLLIWLGNTSEKYAEAKILEYAEPDKYSAAKNEVPKRIEKKKVATAATEYLENDNHIEIKSKDPLWFEKGVASKHIAIPLVNLYYHSTVFGSQVKTINETQDAMLLSMDIIKYICNLLTNFDDRKITFCCGEKKIKVSVTDSVRKPNYNTIRSVFENGWMCLTPGLFDHFLNENLKGLNFGKLEDLPQDSKLLMIALIYFSLKKSNDDVRLEVYSVLLCCAVLSANIDEKKTSMECLQKHLEGDMGVELLHPLVEFQHCLEYMNYLNRLCGAPYKPTIYSKTYNGTFVYKILNAMKSGGDNFLDDLDTALAAVTNILASFRLHIKVYCELMNAR